MEPMTFENCVRKIEAAYDQFGLTDSWRFLYSPKSTLTTPGGLMILGLNPGGTATEPIASVEEGNAYLCEQWKSQIQNKFLKFMLACGEMNGVDDYGVEKLLKESLTSNFMPFRSNTKENLEINLSLAGTPPNYAFNWAKRFWAKIIEEKSPKLILIMGATTYNYIADILNVKHARVCNYTQTKANRQILEHIEYPDGTNIMKIPHLASQYGYADHPILVKAAAKIFADTGILR